MLKPGDRCVGYTYTDTDRIRVSGTVMVRTDDPEEHWQAYYVRHDDGTVYCIDEQECWPA